MTTMQFTALDWQLSIDKRRLSGSPATREITSYYRGLKRSNSNLCLVRSCYPGENWPFLIPQLIYSCMHSHVHALGGVRTRLSCFVSGSRSYPSEQCHNKLQPVLVGSSVYLAFVHENHECGQEGVRDEGQSHHAPAEETETGHPVHAQGLRGSSAPGWAEEVRDLQRPGEWLFCWSIKWLWQFYLRKCRAWICERIHARSIIYLYMQISKQFQIFCIPSHNADINAPGMAVNVSDTSVDPVFSFSSMLVDKSHTLSHTYTHVMDYIMVRTSYWLLLYLNQANYNSYTLLYLFEKHIKISYSFVNLWGCYEIRNKYLVFSKRNLFLLGGHFSYLRNVYFIIK